MRSNSRNEAKPGTAQSSNEEQRKVNQSEARQYANQIQKNKQPSTEVQNKKQSTLSVATEQPNEL